MLDVALVPALAGYGAAIGTTVAYAYYFVRHHLLLEEALRVAAGLLLGDLALALEFGDQRVVLGQPPKLAVAQAVPPRVAHVRHRALRLGGERDRAAHGRRARDGVWCLQPVAAID